MERDLLAPSSESLIALLEPFSTKWVVQPLTRQELFQAYAIGDQFLSGSRSLAFGCRTPVLSSPTPSEEHPVHRSTYKAIDLALELELECQGSHTEIMRLLCFRSSPVLQFRTTGPRGWSAYLVCRTEDPLSSGSGDPLTNPLPSILVEAILESKAFTETPRQVHH